MIVRNNSETLIEALGSARSIRCPQLNEVRDLVRETCFDDIVLLESAFMPRM